MIFYNEAGLVNFVCKVFEQGVKMLTLSSMENQIVECNLKASLRNLLLAGLSLSISKFIAIGWYLSLFSSTHSLLSGIDAPSLC